MLGEQPGSESFLKAMMTFFSLPVVSTVKKIKKTSYLLKRLSNVRMPAPCG